jgi:hypothetical protein
LPPLAEVGPKNQLGLSFLRNNSFNENLEKMMKLRKFTICPFINFFLITTFTSLFLKRKQIKMAIKYKDIVEVFKENQGNELIAALGFVERRTRHRTSPDKIEKLREKIRSMLKFVKSKLQKLSRHWDRFFELNEKWLDTDLYLGESEISASSVKTRGPGRKRQSFDSLKDRAKRARIEKLRDVSENNPILSLEVAQSSASKNKQQDMYKLIKFVIQNQDKALEIYNQCISGKPKKLTPLESVALIHRAGYSKMQYEEMRKTNNSRNSKIFPPWKSLHEARLECRPNNITVKDNKAEVPLDELLNHTLKRIILVNKQAFINYCEHSNNMNLTVEFVLSYGYDGSSSFSQFNQRKSGCDSNLFATTVIPIIIHHNNTVIWSNPNTRSNRSCRPLCLEYQKETKLHILQHQKKIDSAIRKLRTVTFKLNSCITLNVNFKLICSLIDGKILSILTG